MMDRLTLALHSEVIVHFLWQAMADYSLIDTAQSNLDYEYPFELRELGLHVWYDSPSATHPNFDFCTIRYALVNCFPESGNQVPSIKFI